MASSERFDQISPTTDDPQIVRVIVEIAKGRRSKFELDEATGLFKLDRFLYASSHYPGDYGFLPRTLAEDGDALDALVMVNEPTFTGCLIEARVVGVFKMHDHAMADHKILCVPHRDPLFAEYKALENVPAHFLREVEHFFLTYKQLEGGRAESDGWGSVAEALSTIRSAIKTRDR